MNYFFQRIVKRQAMVYFLFLGLACLRIDVKGAETLDGPLNDRIEESLKNNRSSDIFRAQRVGKKYLFYLEKLFLAAQAKDGTQLTPSQFPRVAIKINTAHAPGLQVSPQLIDALLSILTDRGFDKKQIFLVDREEQSLIRGGFLSSTQGPSTYRGHSVYYSTKQSYFDPLWIHDSPMPPTLHDRARLFLKYPQAREKRIEEERKSYLPRILFGEGTFWINVSVVMDSVNLGIDGACANITTGAISNYHRFLEKATLAPAAVTEIMAIPEIWNRRTYSIIDLSLYQFANGGRFDAEFLGREPTLLLSENPFSVDRVALGILNSDRKKHGFKERKAGELLLFQYAKELNLGDVAKAKIFDVR